MRMSVGGAISSYSFNVLFLTQVLSVCSSVIKFNEYITDAGNNISIPCLAHGSTLMWVKEECNETREFVRGPDLRINNIQPSDAGIYICLVSPDESELTQVGNDDDSSWSSQEKPTDNSFLEGLTIVLKVRSVPGPVTKLSVRLSTILGVLIWEYSSNHSGGYPVKSFTAEFRKYCADVDELTNASLLLWHQLDPQNIPANVRYYEVYHLIPNTTYEFRLWANNYLGAGEAVTTSATTLGQLSDESVLDIILKDVEGFDPKIWVYAVGLSMSALVVLGFTLCILLLRDHYLEMEEKRLREEDEWESIGIIPNIILNPGFLEPDDPSDPSPPYTRTIIFGEDVLSTSESGSSEEEEPISFKRKFSLFFTGDTIKRL
ncbi:uncharacterized protein LOC129565929 [Sitodiplosis mosellana]|uniref:uncharacterized protein LOC129565929 n=1 Tax=Sitodiplosis mosellana TaxID=263140 RepID=UPI002443EAFE|nr:uncharacterized protein LOC129565929 [Sitodiplosis mosellana]